MKNFYNLYNLVRDNCKLYFINFKLGIGEIVFISLLLISVTWTIVSAISMNKFEILTAVISYVVSGSLTFYVLDGFNFSNYKLLRFIQKVSIYLILILLSLFAICYLFVYMWDNGFLTSLEVYGDRIIDLIIPRVQHLGIDESDYIHYSSSNDKIASLESSDDNSKYRFEAEISKSTAKTVGDAVVTVLPEVAKDAGSYAASATTGVGVAKLVMKATP